jgi:uncharacterized protein
MKLEGTFKVGTGRAQVYDFLTDPGKVAAALPDTKPTDIRPDGFTAEARVGVGPMRGTIATRLDMVEREPGQRAVYKGQGKGLGSVVDLTAGFSLRDADSGGTAVDWSGDANVQGRLASMAGGMLEPLARKNIERFIESVRVSLEQQSKA